MERAVVRHSAEECLVLYADMVIRTAYTMVKNRHDAEDIAQDVFVSFIRTAPVFESDEHEKAWLLRVTINRCKSFLRSAWQQRTQGLADDMPEEVFTPSEHTVMDAVNALPMRYRQVVFLYYIEGYDTRAIAQILKRPQNTVLSQLARARSLLKKTLKGEFDDG